MPPQERLYYLFDKYIADTANADELDELKTLLNDQSYEVIARDRLVNLLRQTEPLPGHSESRWQAILHGIRAEPGTIAETGFRAAMEGDTATTEIAPARRSRILLTRRWWAVAAVFLGGVTALWLLLRPAPAKQLAADRQSLR